MGIAGRRGAAPIPQLAQGVFPLCPASPAEIKPVPTEPQAVSEAPAGITPHQRDLPGKNLLRSRFPEKRITHPPSKPQVLISDLSHT